MKDTHLKLGDIVKDTITGFEGVITARTDWLNGCIRMCVQPQKLQADGKPVESSVFDVEQLELVQAKAQPVKERSGGPCDDQKAMRR